MYIRKKIRFRLILLALAVLIFIYWRGTRAYVQKNELDCKYHIVYAICNSKSKLVIPSLWDILKAGVKF